MATHALAPAAANTNGSLILALHARYEANFDDYNRLDEAKPAKSETKPGDDAWQLFHRCEDGMSDLVHEADTLRRAILWQVPTTLEEATVLSFHVWTMHDLDSPSPEIDRKALDVGINNLFDFLVTEGFADMERIGRQFSAGAMHAFNRRRARTGFAEAA